jgi:hypothetical protein
MPATPPTDYEVLNYQSLTLTWVVALSLLGGAANYISKVSAGVIKRFSIVELIGDLCVSGFVGFVTFLLCDSAGFDARVTAALVGISGHMGSRAVFMLERTLTKKFSRFIDSE